MFRATDRRQFILGSAALSATALVPTGVSSAIALGTHETAHTRLGALVLLNHRVGMPSARLVANTAGVATNITALAKAAGLANMPVVVSHQVPNTGDLAFALDVDLSGYLSSFESPPLVSALDHTAFADAVLALGRSRLYVAGVNSNAGTLFSVLDLLDLGVDVHVVSDASGSPMSTTETHAIRRMQRAGATITSCQHLLASFAQSALAFSDRGTSARTGAV